MILKRWLYTSAKTILISRSFRATSFKSSTTWGCRRPLTDFPLTEISRSPGFTRPSRAKTPEREISRTKTGKSPRREPRPPAMPRPRDSPICLRTTIHFSRTFDGMVEVCRTECGSGMTTSKLKILTKKYFRKISIFRHNLGSCSKCRFVPKF